MADQTGAAVTMEWVRLQRVLNTLDQQADFSVPLDRCGIEEMRSVGANFVAQGRPDAWQALRPMTLKRRRQNGTGAQILRDTGRLMQSVTWKVSAGPGSGPDGSLYELTTTTLDIGTNLPYAAIQQFGGQIKVAAHQHTVYFRMNKRGEVGNRFVKKSKSNFAQDVQVGSHLINIPPRPYLLIQDEDEETFGEIFADWEKEQIDAANTP